MFTLLTNARLTFAAEAALAELAGVWPLDQVHLAVTVQIGLEPEGLAADVTQEGAGHTRLVLRHLVLPQRPRRRQTLPALGTPTGLFF